MCGKVLLCTELMAASSKCFAGYHICVAQHLGLVQPGAGQQAVNACQGCILPSIAMAGTSPRCFDADLHLMPRLCCAHPSLRAILYCFPQECKSMSSSGT
jgi:hypothetical protein